MNYTLNRNRIEYILSHVSQHVDLSAFTNYFHFVGENEEIPDRKGVFFILSPDQLLEENIRHIDNLPVLFPIGKSNKWFRIERDKVIFNHDILKSAFYLLSGVQELNSCEEDSLGRFPLEKSIQYRLGILGIPVVNYYFRIIVSALIEFTKIEGKIEVRLKERKFTFLLSHDIDQIVKYNYSNTVFKLKQFLGLRKSKRIKKELFIELIRSCWSFLFLSKSRDPYWTFDYLIKLEKKYNIKSTYYFLPKNKKYVDARYDLKEKRLKNLYKDLQEEGHELGLHGTVESSVSLSRLKKDMTLFREGVTNDISGIRQHRLSFKLPYTLINQEKIGLLYDTSLGFAAHEGFRNSYCHPFKLYDFKRERPIDVWEIPLVVMDGTLYSYRELNHVEALSSIKALINEIKQFGGVFSLLWHNSFLDEDNITGIKLAYENILGKIIDEQPKLLTASNYIEKFVL